VQTTLNYFPYKDTIMAFSITACISKEKLAGFCRENHIRKLSLFGSALRDELGPDSDIDILVTLATPTLRNFMGLALYLEKILGRKVDLATDAMIRERMRERIDEEAIQVA